MCFNTLINIPSVHRTIVSHHYDINIPRADCKGFVISVRYPGCPFGIPYDTALYSLYALISLISFVPLFTIITLVAFFSGIALLSPYVIFGCIHFTRQHIATVIKCEPVAGIIRPTPQGRIRSGCLGYIRAAAHRNDTHLGNDHSGFELPHLGVTVTLVTLVAFELRPRIVGRIAALCGGFLVYRDAYVFGIVIRLLVHSASVRVVRVGYPCIIGFPVGTDSTRNARFALDVTPLVIGRIVTLHSGFLVVCQSNVCFSCGIIADSVPLIVIRIAYPRVIGLPVLSRSTGNTVGAIDPVRTISSRFS